jgi:outer membrane receptor protein involved in Fe transport
VFNPAASKVRTRAVLAHGGFSTALFVNYVDSYTDTRGGANIPIASWTTVDLDVNYTFANTGSPLAGVSMSLGATNLTDAPPPYVAPSYTAFGDIVFDGANHDVRGRVVYVQLEKRF